VFKQVTHTTQDLLLGGVNPSQRGGEFNTSNFQYAFYAGITALTGYPTDTSWHCVSMLFNTTASEFRMDGVSLGTSFSTGDRKYCGVEFSSLLGGVGEYIVYLGNESPTTNEAKLITKWGI